MARLNGYLHRIGAVESEQCVCGYATETVEHFLLRCQRWDIYRQQMLQRTDLRRGSVPFFLGGKTQLDDDKWTPNIEVVKATISFAIAIGRLEPEDRPQ